MKAHSDPVPPPEGYYRRKKEESIRDIIAMEAMALCPMNAYEHKQASEWCYDRADAMLKARKK
jgi:hypothetical protein